MVYYNRKQLAYGELLQIAIIYNKITFVFCLQTDPRRLKKDLPKILKGMKPEDRVLIVGTSRTPFGTFLSSLFDSFV